MIGLVGSPRLPDSVLVGDALRQRDCLLNLWVLKGLAPFFKELLGVEPVNRLPGSVLQHELPVLGICETMRLKLFVVVGRKVHDRHEACGLEHRLQR